MSTDFLNMLNKSLTIYKKLKDERFSLYWYMLHTFWQCLLIDLISEIHFNRCSISELLYLSNIFSPHHFWTNTSLWICICSVLFYHRFGRWCFVMFQECVSGPLCLEILFLLIVLCWCLILLPCVWFLFDFGFSRLTVFQFLTVQFLI